QHRTKSKSLRCVPEALGINFGGVRYRVPHPTVYVGAAVTTSHHIGVVRSSEPCRATAASICDALTAYSVLEYSNRLGTVLMIASGPGFTVFGTQVRRHKDHVVPPSVNRAIHSCWSI